MNRVIVTGNIGQEPELKTTQTGKSVCSFSVAVKDDYDKDKTIWLRVTAWGQTAEFVCQYLGKGRKVGIDGRLTSNKFTDKNGVEQERTEITADKVEGLDRPREETGQEHAGGGAPKQAAPESDDSQTWDPFQN